MRDHSLPHHIPRLHLPVLDWAHGYQKSWVKPVGSRAMNQRWFAAFTTSTDIAF